MILLDTNVLIDAAIDRHPYAESASALLDKLMRRESHAFMAWHTVATLYYIVAPSRGGPSTRDFILALLRFVQVAPTSTEAVRYAASLPMPDFEDAMQAAAARACGARHIVTRNIKDFERSPIPAITPQEALLQLR